MLEKIGFLNAKEKKVGYSEQKDKNPEYKPLLIMPNIRNSNNFVGGTNSLYRSLPKNLILDKVY